VLPEMVLNKKGLLKVEYLFDAYMLDIEDLEIDKGHFRLLEASEALFLPVFHNIRIFVTSDDVIHS